MPLLEYTGNAVITSLTAGLSPTATLMPLGNVNGWPTGLTAQWTATIDQGGVNEEKVLCSTRSGNNVTIVQRGYDGTTAKQHEIGETVKHTISAGAMAEASQHVNLTTRDDHTQYLNNTRHDDPLRHTIGTVIAAGVPGTIAPDDIAAGGAANSVARSDHRHAITTNVPVAVGTALAEGVAATFARADHVHTVGDDSVTLGKIADGAIDALALFTAAVRPVAVQAAAPGSPVVGQPWWDTDIATLFIWDGTEWLVLHEPWQTFAGLTWTCVNDAPTLGNGSLVGRYKRCGKDCRWEMLLSFGTTTLGGTGNWGFNLPFISAASPTEHVLSAKAFTNPGKNWDGMAVNAAGTSTVTAFLPDGTGASNLSQVRNSSHPVAIGTGIPQAPGQFTFESGHNFTINGSYPIV